MTLYTISALSIEVQLFLVIMPLIKPQIFYMSMKEMLIIDDIPSP